MKEKLQIALNNELWLNHKIGDTYTMDGKPELWKIAYYPIFEDGRNNGQQYEEPRALVEKPIFGKLDEVIGTDFREVPMRYLTKNEKV